MAAGRVVPFVNAYSDLYYVRHATHRPFRVAISICEFY